MSEKEMYLQTWEREFQTTVKVLKNYPGEKKDFRPHEKSRTAKELAWTFVMEETVIGDAIKGEIQLKPFPPSPEVFTDLIAAYDKSHKEMITKVKGLSEADFNRMVKFPVGPNQMADFRLADVCWFMLMDMVHHRGQFSVYLRMVGGKVPSIYGPSADEPWM